MLVLRSIATRRRVVHQPPRPAVETDTVVVAFYHADFNRCKIVDAHLERLAPKHFHTKVGRTWVDVAVVTS